MRNKRVIYSALLTILSVLILTGCNLDQSQVRETSEYQKKNDALIEQISKDKSYMSSDFGGISQHKYFYKVLEKAPEANKGMRPYQNSKVLVQYSVTLAYSNQEIVPTTETELTIFDVKNANPSGQVTGLQYALQEMEIGDKWEIILPWQLGYGAYSNGFIPAYSTLKYNIKLLKITKL